MRLLAALLLLVAGAAAAQQREIQPEAATGRGADRPAAVATRHMVAAANPHAAEAGLAILRAGGSAADAAIATALVLNVVEPQSSGLGGGGFLVHFNPQSREVVTLDGREAAPLAARPDRFLDEQGRPRGFTAAVASGLAVGVPGLPALLAEAHSRFGKLPWLELVAPAIRLAEEGFPISPRLHGLLAKLGPERATLAMRAVFFKADGKPKATGTVLVQPELARTLRILAAEGAAPFYRGAIARDIVAAVATAADAGDMTPDDLAAYRVVQRAPVCGRYRAHKVCSMGPPSSGGVAILQLLSFLEPHDLASMQPTAPLAVHLFAEAGRLAFADRARYLADPDKVSVPLRGLLDAGYLAGRAALIRLDASLGMAPPGDPPWREGRYAPDPTARMTGTTHLSVVDGEGRAVALTASIEQAFGTRLMAAGFLLNNELTDFAFVPERDGVSVANAPGPGKRPRSSMAPTIVLDPDGRLRLVVGSAGGAAIINDVAKVLVGVLDWGLDPQAAIALPNRGSRNGPTEYEAGTALELIRPALEALGHTVRPVESVSGLHAIAVQDGRLLGGADPRREGVALGD
jgi:gamma-glutamyltranspeptidase/glutathione hydrolase